MESRNSTGSVADREARAILEAVSSLGLDELQVQCSSHLALSLAAASVLHGVHLKVELNAYTPVAVVAELLTFGAELTRKLPHPFDLASLDGERRRVLADLARELVTDLGGEVPGAIVLPLEEELLLSALPGAFQNFGRAPHLAPVDWRRMRGAALAAASAFARKSGVLLGLSGGAGLAALPEMALPRGTVVILDCYAPKFFSAYARVPASFREEGKLGGLITPR